MTEDSGVDRIVRKHSAPKFDPTKTVQTRDGRKSRILVTDRESTTYPIVALVKSVNGCGEVPQTFTSEGLYAIGSTGAEPRDLVNIPEKCTLWLNIYAVTEGAKEAVPFGKREHADAAAKRSHSVREACIKIEYEEGEGLSDD